MWVAERCRSSAERFFLIKWESGTGGVAPTWRQAPGGAGAPRRAEGVGVTWLRYGTKQLGMAKI